MAITKTIPQKKIYTQPYYNDIIYSRVCVKQLSTKNYIFRPSCKRRASTALPCLSVRAAAAAHRSSTRS